MTKSGANHGKRLTATDQLAIKVESHKANRHVCEPSSPELGATTGPISGRNHRERQRGPARRAIRADVRVRARNYDRDPLELSSWAESDSRILPDPFAVFSGFSGHRRSEKFVLLNPLPGGSARDNEEIILCIRTQRSPGLCLAYLWPSYLLW